MLLRRRNMNYIYAGKQSAQTNVKFYQEWCEQFGIIYDEKRHNFYRLQNSMVKSVRFWWEWHMVRLEVTKNVLQKLL
jgi:hypothetical protein